MDDMTRHAAQRMARAAIASVVDAMFVRDPRHPGRLVVRHLIVTEEALAGMIEDAVGADVPITREQMDRHITEALTQPGPRTRPVVEYGPDGELSITERPERTPYA